MKKNNRTFNEVKNVPAVTVVETAPVSEVVETVSAPAPIVSDADREELATLNPEYTEVLTLGGLSDGEIKDALEEERAKAVPPTELGKSDAKPEPKKIEYVPTRSPLYRTVGERDVYGFGKDTETSFLLGLLEEGNRTRPELLSSFLERYAKDEAETKRKKTSFSVFFSDVRRPIGTYHASRSLIILIEEGSGKLSLDSDRAEKVRAAIASGILSELRGLKAGGTKASAVLTKYGFPTV